MMLTLCSTKMTSEHLLSAKLTTREYVFVLLNAKNLSRENNNVYSNLKCLERCAFQCIKSLKMWFYEEQKSLKSD